MKPAERNQEHAMSLPRRWVVMGVSGSGKSTVGRLLAERLGMLFVEGDDFHPAANVGKMAAGEALTDTDRAPWLASLRDTIRQARELDSGLVLTCSALKRSYRDLLRDGDPDLAFLYLQGSQEVLAQRLASRRGHFFPASLLDSQFRDLQPLMPDERGVTVDVTEPAAAIVDQVLALDEH